jgi:hypothetical protein
MGRCAERNCTAFAGSGPQPMGDSTSMKHVFSLGGLRALLVLVLLSGAAGGAFAQPEQYHNGTFGFTVSLPEGLTEYQSVTSPEGITLTSPDGMAVVNIFGSRNAAGKSLGEVVGQYKRDVPDAEFTYEWRGRDAAVLSGYQAGDIFYVRIAMSPDRSRAAILSMIYAPELKRQLDPVVTRLSTSLSIH